MIKIIRRKSTGGEMLDIKELAGYIYQKTDNKPCSIYVSGTQSGVVFIGEFEDVPTHLLFYNFSNDYPYMIKHSLEEIEKCLRRLEHITGVFMAKIKMEVTIGNQEDIQVIN